MLESTKESIILSHQSDSFKEKISLYAKQRVGAKNPMYGKRGELSPMYGRISIVKDGTTKFISREDLPTYINDGWSLGVDRDTIESRRKGKSDLYIYKGINFIGSYEILDYLHENGFPKLSQASLYNLADGISVKGYGSLTGSIKRIRKGENNENKVNKPN